MIEAVILASVLSVSSSDEPTMAELRSTSETASDLRGVQPSLYRGKFYDAKNEHTRRCIVQRESRGHYKVIGGGGDNYHGAYQFHDRNWRRGLVFMMLKESKQRDDGVQQEIRALFDKPINRWNRYFQDRAFWTAWRFGDGASHWAGGRFSCPQQMKHYGGDR
jgi:hypothetical protein